MRCHLAGAKIRIGQQILRTDLMLKIKICRFRTSDLYNLLSASTVAHLPSLT